LIENIIPVGWAVVSMLIGRAVATYALMPLINRFTAPVPIRWQHILFWGGLRGSLSIALALSLPVSLDGRSQVVTMVFGVVMFSLLVQGLSISPLLRWVGFTKPQPKRRDYELVQGQLLGDGAALAELDELRARRIITERVYQVLQKEIAESQQKLQRRATELGEAEQSAEQEQIRRIRHHLADIRKAHFRELSREGILTAGIQEELEEELNRRLPDTDGGGKT
jgi:CPA1 family monovalent cation:H+ antiporter